MNMNVSDDLDEDIVNACMPLTCDVKPYDFGPLAAGAVPFNFCFFVGRQHCP